jgi:peptidoglycan hydrolase CwlO-like protein
LGIYTIALTKASLSGAAAWYDQYIISLSATGAAYQTLIADGGIDQSALSAYQSALSDIKSQLSDLQSDFQSRVPKAVATNSQLSDLHSDLRSYLVVMSGLESDIYSQLSDFRSDLHSFVSTTGVGLHASAFSDIRSAINAITVTISASDVSDIASAVLAGLTTITASDISDIASAVWAHTVGTRVDSRVLVNQSYLSDIRSHVSDLQSDFQSRVPKRVATDSQLSDLHSDLKSYLAVMSGLESDIYSQLSDFRSDLHSFVSTTGVQLNASSLSDLRSAITLGGGILASGVSDIESALASRLSDILSAAVQVNSRVAALPTVATIADGVWDEATAGHTTAGSYGDKTGAHLPAVLKAIVAAAGSTTTAVVLNATTGIDGGVPSATNDFYNGRVIIFTSGALAGQATDITDYVGATQTLTVTALTGAPASGVTAVIV